MVSSIMMTQLLVTALSNDYRNAVTVFSIIESK
jgi:hypothetical protein